MNLNDMFNEISQNHKNSFGEEWENRRSEHLPMSLDVLLRTPILSPANEKPEGCSKQIWTAHQRYRNTTNKTLLLVMGFSSEQIVLSMAAHVLSYKCTRVIPVTTRDVWSLTANGNLIKDWWDALRSSKQELPEWNTLVDKDRISFVRQDSPSSVFKSLRKTIKEDSKYTGEFAIDATGGTKPMDTGAAAFAAYFDLPAYYAATSEYNYDLRRPNPETVSYTLLDRPTSTFTQSKRQSILDSFQSGDFPLVEKLSQQILDEIGPGGEFEEYFLEEADGVQIKKVNELAKCAFSWQSEGCFDPQFCHELEVPTTDVNSFVWNESRVGNTDERAIIRTLRDKSTLGNWELMIEYFVSEYYRLKSLEVFSSQVSNLKPLPQYEHVREVLTVGYGLAESILDSILFLPISQNWILATPKTVCQKKLLQGGCDSYLRTLGWRYPNPDNFWLKYSSKVDLLLNGIGLFAVRAKMISIDKESMPQVLQQAYESTVWNGSLPTLTEVSMHDRDTAVEEFRLMLRFGERSNACKIRDRGTWDTLFGMPKDQSEWSRSRNAITHVRAPVSPRMIEMAKLVVNSYLPRFIELYLRLCNVAENDVSKLPIDLDQAKAEGWITWTNDERWAEEKLVPWHGRGEDVKTWLGLTL